MRAAVLFFLALANFSSAVDVHSRLLSTLSFDAATCSARGNVPVDVKLMKSDAEAEGWGASYFSLNFFDPASSEAGRLDKGSFASGAGNLDMRSLCLEQGLKYSFSVSTNKNAFEIGAVVCGNHFVKSGQTLHFSVQENRCISFADEQAAMTTQSVVTEDLASRSKFVLASTAAGSAPSGSGAAGGGSGANGASGPAKMGKKMASNLGSGAAGSGAAGGSGAKGSVHPGGSASKGSGANGSGSGAKGSGAKGSGAKGSGSGAKGSGSGAKGSGAKGSGAKGSGAKGSGSGAKGSGAKGSGSGAHGGSGASSSPTDIFAPTHRPTEYMPPIYSPPRPTFAPTSTAFNAIPSTKITFGVKMGFSGAQGATGGSGGGFALVVAKTAAKVTGLKAADFSNMEVSSKSVDRVLTTGSGQIEVSFDVTLTPKEVGTMTPQSTYNAVKSKLETSVSNHAFSQAMAKAASAMGVQGLDQVQATVTVTAYNVLSPTASPTSGAQDVASEGQASNSAGNTATVGVSVGVSLAVVGLAALAFVAYKRSAPKDFVPKASAAGTVTAAGNFKSHDFDAEPDASSVVSPMATKTSRISTVDEIPDARVSVSLRSNRRL